MKVVAGIDVLDVNANIAYDYKADQLPIAEVVV